MDINKAFSVDNGIIVDEDTNGPFFTGGAASPVGLGLPANTFYLQTVGGTTGVVIWHKYGAGDTASDWREYSSKHTSFDPTGSDLVSLNAEDAIKELANTVGVSASPGFGYGRSGAIVANTWLNTVGGVPSNKAGITVALNNPEVTQIYVANEDVSTFDIEVYEHQGNEVSLALLGTVSVVSARSAGFTVSYAVTSGYQLGTKVSAGSAKNCNVGLQLKGNV